MKCEWRGEGRPPAMLERCTAHRNLSRLLPASPVAELTPLQKQQRHQGEASPRSPWTHAYLSLAF